MSTAKRLGCASALCTASFFALVAPNAMAQEQQENEPKSRERVVVTAQKREEAVQDVPQSIDVISSEQLERQQVNQIYDLQLVSPSLELTSARGQGPGGGGQIRGIGTQSFNTGAVGSVGIVVDQVSQGNVNIENLFDIARVEVLKGPQGTLFGLTTSAGVINVTTAAPDPSRYSARLRTELAGEGILGAQFGQQVVQGLVNVPLSEDAAFRLAGFATERQGFSRNTVNNKFDQHSTYGFRGRFLYEITPDLTLNLIGEYSNRDAHDGDDLIHYAWASPQFQAAALDPCGITAGEGSRDYCISSDFPSSSTETYGASAQIDYDFGPVMFTSVSAFREQAAGPTILNIFRLDTGPRSSTQGPAESNIAAGLVQGDQINITDLRSQEFRIASPTGSRLEYTTGVFYSTVVGDSGPGSFCLEVNAVPDNNPCTGAANIGNIADTEDTQTAVFGQATFNLSDTVSLIGGARYTDQELSILSTAADMSSSRFTSAAFDNLSWRLGARYRPNPNTMLYGSVARGYKGPQIRQGRVDDPSTVDTIINPEIPTSSEIGFKYTLPNGMLLDTNAFYVEVEDYQGQSCYIGGANNTLICDPVNVDGVISKGAEINLAGRVTDNLTLSSGLIYNFAVYPDGYLASDGVTDLGGEQLLAAPEWKFTLSGEYSQSFGQSLEGFIAADTVYRSDVRYAQSTNPLVFFDAHWVVGGRFGIRSQDGRWTASVFGRNLTNEHAPVYRLEGFAAGQVGQIFNQSAFRLVGVSLDHKF